MNSPINAVIFDFDGVLIDSEPVWDEAYDLFVLRNKVKDDPRYWGMMTGMGLKEVVELMVEKMELVGNVDDLLEEFRWIFYQILKKRRHLIIKGVIGFLKKVKTQKLKTAVATGGHSKKTTIELLKKFKLLKFFDKIVSSDDVRLGKPAPDIYFLAARELAVDPVNCLVLEDSLNGVQAAKTAGMMVIGVNKGQNIRDRLSVIGCADDVVSSLDKIQLNTLNL